MFSMVYTVSVPSGLFDLFQSARRTLASLLAKRFYNASPTKLTSVAFYESALIAYRIGKLPLSERVRIMDLLEIGEEESPFYDALRIAHEKQLFPDSESRA